MTVRSIGQRFKAFRAAILIAGAAGLTMGFVSWAHLHREHRFGVEDLERRARIIVQRMQPLLQQALAGRTGPISADLREQLDGYSRLIGFALYAPDGTLLAAGKGAAEYAEGVRPLIPGDASPVKGHAELLRLNDVPLHVLVTGVVLGAGDRAYLAVLHDASYLEERAAQRLVQAAFWTMLLTLGLATALITMTWALYERPLSGLADWMRRVRLDDVDASPPPVLGDSDLTRETAHLAASLRAARQTTIAKSREIVHGDSVWSRERLGHQAMDILEGRPLVVVSNREPYIHQLTDGEPKLIVPASGLVTAMEPVLQACSGLWVAHGSGDADRKTVDAKGRIRVPPADERYTLKRVWLSRDQEQGYYYGFSNEGLWPLCHLAHERPVFRAADWAQYRAVNRLFADAVLEEVGSTDAWVWVHDYHLALVPRLLKEARPGLRVGLFWHIPWPTPEALRICPWKSEILEGMLGADLVGFHLQQHCNNFLESVDRMVEARLDWDRFSADLKGSSTLVRPFPISVQSWAERDVPQGEELERQIADLRTQHGLEREVVGVGVDRIDYTKGLLERLRGIDRFLVRHPEWKGRFVFVQLGAPSRTHIRRYRELVAELESTADEINWKHQSDGWQPIRLLIAHHDAAAVHAFMRMADFCIVSSLHDGMNLVAKEYAAAHGDGDGALILSEFAGASHELSGAIVVNPYDTDALAQAIHRAVTLDPDERRLRMIRMHRVVSEHNVYRWAADFLACLGQSRQRSPASSAESSPVVRGT